MPLPPTPSVSPDFSPEVLSGLVDLAEDAIVAVAADQTIVLFNRGAEKAFGYRAAEVLGRPLDLLIPERYADAHRRDVEEFARSPVPSRAMGDRRPVFGRRKDGTEFPAEATIAKARDRGGVFLTAILRDVSERTRAEAEIRDLNQTLEGRVRARTAELEAALAEVRGKTEQLQATTQQLWQAAKLASVGELAAGVAHELNNPLGTVSLRLELALAALPPDLPCRADLAVVEGEVERMARLVENLLQFSRPSRDQVSTVDLADELVRTAELVAHQFRRRGVELRFEVAPDLPLLYADRQKLRQVFLNLFTNAGDAMPAGGTLTVAARPGEASAGAPGVVVEVSDTGSGIPPDLLPRVMDPFVTTKAEGKGTGLGLAICRRIVQEHRGTIRIESRPGAGTTVRLVFPVSRPENVSGLQE